MSQGDIRRYLFRFFHALGREFFSVTSQGFSIPLIVALAVGVWLLHHFFAPSAQEEAWVSFHLLLTAGVAACGFAIFGYFFPSRSGCILFYSTQNEVDKDGNWCGNEVSCLEASVGSVVEVDASGIKRRKPYCVSHDPSQRWMEEWLRRKGLSVDFSTIRRNRFAERKSDDA